MSRRNIRIFFVAFWVCLWMVSLFSYTLASEPRYGGTLRIGVFIPQDRLDARNMSIPALVPAATMIYDPLFGWGEKGFENLIPSLATSYETKDNKVWTFRLRGRAYRPRRAVFRRQRYQGWSANQIARRLVRRCGLGCWL